MIKVFSPLSSGSRASRAYLSLLLSILKLSLVITRILRSKIIDMAKVEPYVAENVWKDLCEEDAIPYRDGRSPCHGLCQQAFA